jgi:hypothetical protein
MTPQDVLEGWPARASPVEGMWQLRNHWPLPNSPLQHAKRIAQLVAEADKRGKAELVDEARQWVKSHEPSKQE